ncbi:hypothetical protein LTR84_009868 [Exophiala bonariae]|uniref:MARVEL domain-containing protein n=1 Tax=Exophiala bonariae TaxID=1690606 RepID=A0AAV9NN50_9EURO|nr:hypothetical protein LTR84_009868 [Exophiala bonariae]
MVYSTTINNAKKNTDWSEVDPNTSKVGKMDPEKQSQTSSISSKHAHPPIAKTNGPPVIITVIRAAQYIWSVIALVFISCAIDRNILVPGVSADEKVLGASSVLAVIVVLYHFLSPYRKVSAAVVDGLLAAFLFATFIYGAYNAGQRQGACLGPDKMGIWDNTRGCKRMTIAVGFSAVNFASFSLSAVLVLLL